MKSRVNGVCNGFDWHKSIRNHSLIDIESKFCKQIYFIYVCKDELLHTNTSVSFCLPLTGTRKCNSSIIYTGYRNLSSNTFLHERQEEEKSGFLVTWLITELGYELK